MSFLRWWRNTGLLLQPPHLRLTTRPSILHARMQPRLLPAVLAIAVASEGYYIWSSRNQKSSESSKPLESLPVAPGFLRPSQFQKSPVEPLTLELAEAKLTSGQAQGDIKGVRFHAYQLGANYPVEDQYVYDSQPSVGAASWYYWGVFDGHAGWATSSLLKDTLVPMTAKALRDSNGSKASATIREVFLNLDQEIMDNAAAFLQDIPKSRTDGIAALAPAIAGSCALLAIFDPKASTLRVANVGDSRAVLGRYDEATGKYSTIKLSEDQTGFNAKEVARLSAAHPGEDKIIDPRSGRLLGMAITRGFGDHRWKWPIDLIEKARERYRGSAVRPLTKTPPYMTAEPEISETQINKGGHGDFVIMASDGLWDNISSEDAVECVARWLNTPPHMRNRKKKHQVDENDPLWDGRNLDWMATPEFFVVENENAATHLAKNAFGGSRRDLFCAVMSAYPPFSRHIRDDITIQVIFFGDQS